MHILHTTMADFEYKQLINLAISHNNNYVFGNLLSAVTQTDNPHYKKALLDHIKKQRLSTEMRSILLKYIST